MFTIGAFAIIFDEKGRVLLSHRRDYDLWNLPGGRVESGEMPTEAVIRETREETGLEVSVEKLFGVYGKTDSNDIVFAFRCKVIGGKLRVTEEADQNTYFDLGDLPENTVPKQVERIEDAVNFDQEPVFRRQHTLSSREFLEEITNT